MKSMIVHAGVLHRERSTDMCLAQKSAKSTFTVYSNTGDRSLNRLMFYWRTDISRSWNHRIKLRLLFIISLFLVMQNIVFVLKV